MKSKERTIRCLGEMLEFWQLEAVFLLNASIKSMSHKLLEPDERVYRRVYGGILQRCSFLDLVESQSCECAQYCTTE